MESVLLSGGVETRGISNQPPATISETGLIHSEDLFFVSDYEQHRGGY